MVASKNESLDLDTKILAEFLFALNIARRQILAYPKGHPVIATAAAKLVGLLPKLLEFRSEITIGVARDTLMVSEQVLDSKNPVFRDLAQNLFRVKIASLTITRELHDEEVCRFFEFFRQGPEHHSDASDFARLLNEAGLKGIRAQGIDFNAFSATEVDVVQTPKAGVADNETTLLWKSFTKGLISGTLDPGGGRFSDSSEIDPDLLAEAMNHDYNITQDVNDGSYEEAITAFLKEADQENIRKTACEESLGKLGRLVEKLNPELRRRFLNSTLKVCAHRPEDARAILEKYPHSVILDAFEQLESNSLHIPKSMMDILGKLSMHRGEEISHSRIAGASDHSPEVTRGQLHRLFSEDQIQGFVPYDYQEALDVLAAAKLDSKVTTQQLETMMSSVEGHSLEKQFTKVILDLIRRGVDEPTGSAIERNISEMVEFFLEIGDFASLEWIFTELQAYQSLIDQAADVRPHVVLHRYVQKEFAEQVLDGLDLWGKAAHQDIKNLIKKVGPYFVEPLLDRLCEETNISKRRLYMECLIEIGPITKGPIVQRLHDRRWYFVRNLVILLRELDDRSVLIPLGNLVGYNHPKVQYEVMATFLRFGDPRADRFLLKELESQEPSTLINAIRLSGKSRDRSVATKVAQLLNAKLPYEQEAIIKETVLNAITEINNDVVLPELEDFIFSRKILDLSRTNALKIQALKLLNQLGTAGAGQLAEKVCHQASGELAQVAEKVCQKIKEKSK